MRLINVEALEMETFLGRPPKYAILSHTWGDNEVTFEDWTAATWDQKSGFKKLTRACDQARIDGYRYIWVDSCCINKDSSSELSEAINSMFAWYRDADVCYAYLEDAHNIDDLRAARWFTRGWTLQELLAPKRLCFFNSSWEPIGWRHYLADVIGALTGIQWQALMGTSSTNYVRSLSVAKKMAWAATRVTTREEDIAYCLLGLFDVNMPLLYGEGGVKAFKRLQQEIIKDSLDLTFLVGSRIDAEGGHVEPATRWQVDDIMQISTDDTRKSRSQEALRTAEGVEEADIGLLATNPSWFVNCGSISTTGEHNSSFVINNQGLQIKLRIVQPNANSEHCIAVLPCTADDRQRRNGTNLIGIPVRRIYRHERIFIRMAGPSRSISPAFYRNTHPSDCCILSIVPEKRRFLEIVNKTNNKIMTYHFNEQSHCWAHQVNPDSIELYHPTKYHMKTYGVTLTEPFCPDPFTKYFTDNFDQQDQSRDSICLIRIDFDSEVSPYAASIGIESLRTKRAHNTKLSGNSVIESILEIPPKGFNKATREVMTIRKAQSIALSADIHWKQDSVVDTLVLQIQIVNTSPTRKDEEYLAVVTVMGLLMCIIVSVHWGVRRFTSFAPFDYQIVPYLVTSLRYIWRTIMCFHIFGGKSLFDSRRLYASSKTSIAIYLLALVALLAAKSSSMTVYILLTPQNAPRSDYFTLKFVGASVLIFAGWVTHGTMLQRLLTAIFTLGLRLWIAYWGFLL
ncbi:Nn.00g012100.m01.CDS01 [Neocucurbitaria sp. VM-36]